ncbi:YpmS family protein [Evansella sp. AB-rgal1]|uniref:YpmS family protein n=1 Tax=Evansella sp. AB-rgal1 TaxID=3242696 RepID=UPI00359D9DE3
MKLKKKNPWKIAFITLFTFLVLVIVSSYLLFSSLFTSSGTSFRQLPEFSRTEGAQFIVSTSKEDINYWLKKELQKEQEGSQQYDLFFDDFVYFQTELNVLGVTIPMQMTLEPQVTESGNLQLFEKSFQIGNFNLPSERIFQLMDATVELPDWIYIYPMDRKLYLDIANSITHDIQVSIKTFNLQENQIEIELIIP